MESFEKYYEAIRYLDALAALPVKDDYMRGSTRPWIFLKRTAYFLGLLHNPQRGFKYIHIAGTSGKGTVTSMVHDALFKSGKRVGSFTSPYVTTAIEKIRVNDLYIDPFEFADIISALKPHIERAKKGPYGRPTYFEVFFAIALEYFRRQKCEWVVLEVGMGGRYDATNIIENPVLTAVTNIDYDHVQILGKTLLSIADNKIGIAKKGSTFFTTEKRPALLKLFQKRCTEIGTRFHALPVTDDYMENNRTLARALCKHIGLPGQVVEQSVQAARLPCRFEKMQASPRVILDGAHNRAKMRSTVSNLKKMSRSTVHLILGINATKDASAIVKEIVPCADHLYLTSFDRAGVVSVEPDELAKVARAYVRPGASVSTFRESTEALDAALNAANKRDIVLATGSFYMVGALRARWYPENWILSRRKSF